jgi:hypothetical protein
MRKTSPLSPFQKFRMASAGTLLSDLDQKSGGNDGDLVNQILSDLNIPTASQNQVAGRGPPPPPMPSLSSLGGQQAPIYQQQMAATTAPITMDSRVPTAHIIGNEHPTPADFAAAMTGMAGVRPNEQMLQGSPVGAMPGAYPSQQVYEPPSKNFYGKILDEVKIPFIVALLFFVFSLPPIRVLVAHYLPTFIKSTGEFTVVGLASASGVVGLTFWILQRIIAPLLSF